jgi:hypothetical protein
VLFVTVARELPDRAQQKSPPVLRRASFRLTYKIELRQDPPHTDRPMVMMVMPGGGHC